MATLDGRQPYFPTGNHPPPEVSRLLVRLICRPWSWRAVFPTGYRCRAMPAARVGIVPVRETATCRLMVRLRLHPVRLS